MIRIVPIVRREFLERVRTKTFIIGTLAGPAILGGLMLVPALMADRVGTPLSVAVLDLRGEVGDSVENALRASENAGRKRFDVRLALDDEGATSEERIAGLRGRVLAGELDGVVVLPKDMLETSTADYYGRNVSNMGELQSMRWTINDALREFRLRRAGLTQAQLEQATRNLELKTVRLSEEGDREDRGASFVFSIVMLMMMYTSTLIWGQALANSVIEEKSNRVMEVMASSVSPFEMLTGKLLGVGAAGLVQFLVWGLAIALVGLYGTAALPNAAALPAVSPLIVAAFVGYFLLGFFLYGSIYAGVGAMVNTPQEAQQMLMPVMLPIILGMMFFPVILRSPDADLSVALSLIPVFTPLLMFLRITVLAPPAWQIALSVLLMLLAIGGVVWASARIYRVGILMYGKRPTFPEIVRWVRRR
jgi:ABC-2 type transport system permease protein